MNYLNLQNKLNAYRLALTTLSFDRMTIAPKDGEDYRNQAISFLSGEYFKILMEKETQEILEQALKSQDIRVHLSAKHLLEEIEKQKKIPYERFIAYTQAQQEAQSAWSLAREKNDYKIFAPALEKLINLSKEIYSYRGSSDNLYDQMLNDYEKGLNQKTLDRFFTDIKNSLPKLLKKVESQQAEKPDFLQDRVPIEKQREISHLLMDYLGFKSNFSFLAETEHPFSSTFSLNDTRIATNYKEDDFISNIFSIIHEIGHSMYNHQVNKDFEGYPIAYNMSMSMHESQSRFLENNIGRSKSFWKPLYPQLQAIIPDLLESVSLDEFIQAINYVETSHIRTEADEISYALHILIRYEIEQEIFEKDTDIKNLNRLFADKMEKYLGLRPKDDKQGILQDIHWASGSFGYFPTYALGSAYAAQIHYGISQKHDLNKLLENGEIEKIFTILRENIHTYGGSKEADWILKNLSKESFNPNYFIQYLEEKYSSI